MTLPEKLPEMVDAYLDGDLEPSQVTNLEEWLKADVMNARRFAREVYVHRELRGSFQAQGDEECLKESTPPPRAPILGWLAEFTSGGASHQTYIWTLLLVCLLLVGGVVGSIMYRHNANPGPAGVVQVANVQPHSTAAGEPAGAVETNDDGRRPIARLMRSWKAEWSDPDQPLSEWTPLGQGQIVELTSGQVEIFFEVGAQLVLQGPIRFQLLGPKSARLFYGDLTVRVGEKARGFSLSTSVGKVIDLGTEFGISVQRNGRTDVVVFDGVVDLEHLSDDGGGVESTGAISSPVLSRLTAGEAVQIKPDGSAKRIVAIDSNRFRWAAAGIAPRPKNSTVIKSVSDSIHTPGAGPFYEVVRGGLGEDVGAYVDRPHEWNGIDTHGIPEFLLGADYVKTFNDDKWSNELELTIDVSQPADLYIFWDDNLKSVPRWLSEGFNNTGLKIGLDSAPYRDSHSGKTITVSNGVDLKPAVGGGNSIDGAYSIWHREVTKPGLVKLGPTGRKLNALGAMYGVAAVAK